MTKQVCKMNEINFILQFPISLIWGFLCSIIITSPLALINILLFQDEWMKGQGVIVGIFTVILGCVFIEILTTMIPLSITIIDDRVIIKSIFRKRYYNLYDLRLVKQYKVMGFDKYTISINTTRFFKKVRVDIRSYYNMNGVIGLIPR